jgi:hypothetical protein
MVPLRLRVFALAVVTVALLGTSFTTTSPAATPLVSRHVVTAAPTHTRRTPKHRKHHRSPSGTKRRSKSSKPTSAPLSSGALTVDTTTVTGSTSDLQGAGSTAGSSGSGAAATTPELFDGSLASSWYLNQSATSSRVDAVADPAGGASPTLQFTTYNGDVAPLTPTANPRSQLVSPQNVLTPGETVWESFEVYLPSSFPATQPSDGWICLQTPVYGAPYTASPPAEIYISDGEFRFGVNGAAPAPYALPWSMPLVEDRWVRFTWHFLISSDASTGWIELYVNGTQVPLNDGHGLVSRLPIALIDSGDAAGPWFSQLQLYYMLNEFPSLSVLYRGFNIAATQAAAEQLDPAPSV